MITQQMISDEVQEAYSNKSVQEQATAQMAYNIGLQWVQNQPVTWCSIDSKSKREARREQRRKRKEQADAIYNDIYSKIVPNESKEIDGVQVVGIGFIALFILKMIISWVVQQILSHYFAENA